MFIEFENLESVLKLIPKEGWNKATNLGQINNTGARKL